MKKLLIAFLLLFSVLGLLISQNPVLDEYLREGLESNKSLKQHQLDYTKSLLALKEAKGLFFPDISINARYTLADGGRVISFPVGDLLNPVYNTLNLLTASDKFPEIDNLEFSFYRAKEQETKVSLIQPIYSSDIIHNVKIKQVYTEMTKVDVDQYKRELIREIKTAYYNYQKAYFIGNLVDSAMQLVRENLRVSASLYKNDIVTVDAVYRSEAEVSKLEVEKTRSEGMLATSRAYFNFLLNRPLSTEIDLFNESPQVLLLSLEEVQELAVSSREEMELIKKARVLNNHLLGLQRGSATPDIYGAIDYGFQGETYSFTQDDDFILASLVLKWNLFHGMTNRNKIRQTKIEGEKLEEVLNETDMKIRMQVMSHYYSVLTSYDAITAAKKQVLSAKKGFTLVDRKYHEGQASLLEYIDARTNYTNAESNLIVSTNDYFISLANLEFSAANRDLSIK